ncbi:MAG: G8 domain-containing protein, partial [Pseudomonadota bacterium]
MADILWSEFRMPDGSVPGPDDVVVVDSDVRLIFDADEPVTIKGLVVYGTFIVEEAETPINLTTDWAVAAMGGDVVIGAPDAPYEGEFTWTLAGKNNS